MTKRYNDVKFPRDGYTTEVLDALSDSFAHGFCSGLFCCSFL